MERRIDALWTSGRIADTIAEIQAYQTFGRDSVPGFDPHNGVELDRLQGARRSLPMTSTVLLRDGLRCVKSADATTSHRIGGGQGVRARRRSRCHAASLAELWTLTQELNARTEA